jgi:hypothetical protein
MLNLPSPIYESITISNSGASESISGFWVSHFLENHDSKSLAWALSSQTGESEELTLLINCTGS